MNITAVNSIEQSPNTSQAVDKTKQAELAKLRKACEQFESLFIYYMLKTMRDASDKSSLFGEGFGSEIYSQLFDEGLADKMAENGPFGIGDMLMKTYAKQAGLSEEEYKTYNSVISKPFYHYRPNIKVKAATPKVAADPAGIENYQTIIDEASKTHKVDPQLVKAVILQESGGDPKAISAKGAKGLMQLMDGTAEMLGVSDPFDIKQNINGGVKYLAGLITKFQGDLKKALAAYNAGPGAVEKYDGVPPFEETKNYVNSILDSLQSSNNLENFR
jgi:Rod binding domain-containing protein